MPAEPQRNSSDAGAAARLLDRAVPDDYLLENTARFARPKPAEEPKTESVVVLRAGAEWVGLGTSLVVEIVGARAIHALPHRRLPLLGVANIRGELVTCLSLPDLLGAATAAGEPTRILVVQSPTGRVAFPVADVSGTHRFHPSARRPAPTIGGRAAALVGHVADWNDRTIGLIDGMRLFRAVDAAIA